MDPNVPHVNRDLVDNGSYAVWLHPFVELGNINLDVPSERAPATDEVTPAPARRGRGRPRVSTAHDASAIEVR